MKRTASPQESPTQALPQSFPKSLCWLRLCCGLFALAALLAGYLAWVALSGGAVAGCGLESACNRVLQSRWAYWLHIPVSLPAMAVYVALLMAAVRRIAALHAPDQRREGTWVVPLAAVVIAAAIWFVFLQVVVIRAFCVFCLTAHLAAVGGAAILLVETLRRPVSVHTPPRRAFGTPVLAGLVGVALLIGGQFLLVKPMNNVSTITAPAIVSSAAVTDRILSLYDGRFQLDLETSPRIGSPSAPHVIVSLFDYTCAHCRSLHVMLDRTWQQSGSQLTILTLPMPLDASCNPLVRQTSSENLDACEYARLALAVWRSKPEAFPQFHSWLFAPPRPPALEEARRHAEHLVGREALELALGGEWIKRQLEIDIQLFEANSKRAGAWQMPQLMVGKSLSVGAINNVENLHLMLREQFGLSISP